MIQNMLNSLNCKFNIAIEYYQGSNRLDKLIYKFYLDSNIVSNMRYSLDMYRCCKSNIKSCKFGKC